MSEQPGLPLTTGEGNTADLERALTAAEEAIASGQRAVAGWQECAAECARLREIVKGSEQRVHTLAALFDVPDGGKYLNDWKERAKEVRRLREQLDAVDDVLIKAIGDVTGLSMAGWDSERRWLGQVALARLEAARAALEAVGRADTGSGARAADGAAGA